VLNFSNLFRRTTLDTVVKQDLEEARLALHNYRAQSEYYAHMVTLHEKIVLRLANTAPVGGGDAQL
jgi:hypothetical protein